MQNLSERRMRLVERVIVPGRLIGETQCGNCIRHVHLRAVDERAAVYSGSNDARSVCVGRLDRAERVANPTRVL